MKSRGVVARLRRSARRIPFLWKPYWALRLWRESRRDYPESLALIDPGDSPEPQLERPVSQLCTASQIQSPRYRHWCKILGIPPRFMRKHWEYVYILEALASRGVLRPGSHGLGFGCGGEPLPGVFAALGCEVLATDQSLERAADEGWVRSREHSDSIDDLYRASSNVVDRQTFGERVSFVHADMNDVPPGFGGFDFVWSACALEHLGSLEHGLAFIRRSIGCLKPGGVAVHTTEFNLSSDDDTVESPACSVYRRQDIVRLAQELEAEGHRVAPLNFNHGDQPVDRHVDVPPYEFSPHLKLQLESYVVTSIGLIVQRGAAGPAA